MSDRLVSLMGKRLHRLWITQMGVCLVVGVAFCMAFSSKDAYSALLGGSTYILANVYFAKRVFSVVGASQLKKIIKNVYRAEAMKILITAGLLGVGFYSLDVNGWSFLSGYIAVQMTIWFVPVVFK